MLENEYQPDIQVSTKKFNKVKIYAIAAIIATVIAVVLRTVCLFYFYDIDIGYHSEGAVNTVFEVFVF